MKKLMIVLFACGIFTTACKKSKDAPPPPPPPALTMANVAGAYKIVADTTITPEGISSDLYANYQPCAKDDIWKFNADSTLEVTDAGDVCDPSSGWTGSWSLEEKNITVVAGGTAMNGTVSKWDGSIMEVTLLFDDGSKDKMTFKK